MPTFDPASQQPDLPLNFYGDMHDAVEKELLSRKVSPSFIEQHVGVEVIKVPYAEQTLHRGKRLTFRMSITIDKPEEGNVQAASDFAITDRFARSLLFRRNSPERPLETPTNVTYRREVHALLELISPARRHMKSENSESLVKYTGPGTPGGGGPG